ncbi:unnamed protein product, partial [marine sediment metagenome]
MKNIILPPPLVKVTEAIDDIDDVNIPGEISRSPDGKLLVNTIKYQGFTGDLLRSYNNMIKVQIPNYLRSQKIILSENKYVRVADFKIWLMTTSSSNTNRITPLMAREMNLSYSAPMYVSFETVTLLKQGDKVIEHVSPATSMK